MKFTEIWIKFKPFYTALLLITALCAVKKTPICMELIFLRSLNELEFKLSSEIDLRIYSGSTYIQC